MTGERRFRWGAMAAAVGLALLLAVVGCSRRENRPNIVVLVLDTLRRDAAGLALETTPAPLRIPGLMPRLAGLSRESVTFTGAFAAAPWTVPSHASMFTGRLPSDHRCTNLQPRLDASLATFAGLLDAGGYQTAAFYSNPWLSDRTTGLLSGFSLRREAAIGDMFTLRSRRGDQGGGETVANIADWLESRDDGDPFLLFANFLEPHLSFDPPPIYRSRLMKDLPPTDTISITWAHQFNAGVHAPDDVDWNRVGRLYAGDVWTTDRLMGEVLDLLLLHGLADDTVVIITSDHGENLGDHGLMDHQYSVHETLLAVPLVVHVPEVWRETFAPGAPRGGVRSDPVLLTDLYATVLDLAGIPSEVRTPFSRSWFASPAPADRPLISEYAGPSPGLLGMLEGLNPGADLSRLDRAQATVRVGDLRLNTDSRGVETLYDMVADPGQKRDLSASHPGVVDALLEIIRASVTPSSEDDPDPVEIDEATRRQLESLGYIH